MYQKSCKQGRRLAWLNRNLLLELQRKKKVCGHWKQGQATQKDYRVSISHCRKKICMVKGQLDLKLASTMVDNKKVFRKYANSKRRTKENIGPLLDKVCHRTTG